MAGNFTSNVNILIQVTYPKPTFFCFCVSDNGRWTPQFGQWLEKIMKNLINQWNLIRTGEPRNFPCQLACNHRWYYPQLLRFFVLGLYPLMLLARWGFPHGNPVGIQRWSQQVSFHFHIGSSLHDFFYKWKLTGFPQNLNEKQVVWFQCSTPLCQT